MSGSRSDGSEQPGRSRPTNEPSSPKRPERPRLLSRPRPSLPSLPLSSILSLTSSVTSTMPPRTPCSHHKALPSSGGCQTAAGVRMSPRWVLKPFPRLPAELVQHIVVCGADTVGLSAFSRPGDEREGAAEAARWLSTCCLVSSDWLVGPRHAFESTCCRPAQQPRLPVLTAADSPRLPLVLIRSLPSRFSSPISRSARSRLATYCFALSRARSHRCSAHIGRCGLSSAPLRTPPGRPRLKTAPPRWSSTARWSAFARHSLSSSSSAQQRQSSFRLSPTRFFVALSHRPTLLLLPTALNPSAPQCFMSLAPCLPWRMSS